MSTATLVIECIAAFAAGWITNEKGRLKRRRRCRDYSWVASGSCPRFEVPGCETQYCAEHCRAWCHCGIGQLDAVLEKDLADARHANR